jgi:hypothetical protein
MSFGKGAVEETGLGVDDGLNANLYYMCAVLK